MYKKRLKIVIFTDCYDIAYNEIYQSLDQGLYDAGLDHYQIDPMVPIPNFSVVNAAFQIRLLAELYGPNSVFLVIMNSQPNNPERIFGKTKTGLTFVGNNSGYFNWLFEDFGVELLYKNHIDRKKDSRSFGGKHVQVPTTCKILSGTSMDEIGQKADKSMLSDFKIEKGTVVHCDNFGLMKIYESIDLGLDEGQKLTIKVNGEARCDAIYSKKLKCHADGTWVLFHGSSLSGLPELGKVRASHSARVLGVRPGDRITWKIK